MFKKKVLLNNVALFIALLFHISGVIGILFTSYKHWFIQNTAINLLLMCVLLVLTQPRKNRDFFLFVIITYTAGLTAEVIGANTSFLFGDYEYGDVLGAGFFGVPLIIGVNWFIVIYCTGVVTQIYENRMLKRLEARDITISKRMKSISFVTDAALLCVLFDWLMEPVAVKLGYWQWQNEEIPFFNYISWFIISALLLALFRRLDFRRHNIFAVHLFIIQLLFFFVLRTFL
jgi:putative membrane protein